MLLSGNHQPETRDRGLLLEQLRQLSAPRYTLGGLGNFTPAWKKDVNQHRQYIADIKGPLEVLFGRVESAYHLVGFTLFGSLKEFFDDIKKDFGNALQWYSKGKTVEDALKIFQGIYNRLTQAFSRITEHAFVHENVKTELHSAITNCYAPLKTYIAYIGGFIPKK
jgi:hypothetical protein